MAKCKCHKCKNVWNKSTYLLEAIPPRCPKCNSLDTEVNTAID